VDNRFLLYFNNSSNRHELDRHTTVNERSFREEAEKRSSGVIMDRLSLPARVIKQLELCAGMAWTTLEVHHSPAHPASTPVLALRPSSAPQALSIPCCLTDWHTAVERGMMGRGRVCSVTHHQTGTKLPVHRQKTLFWTSAIVKSNYTDVDLAVKFLLNQQCSLKKIRAKKHLPNKQKLKKEPNKITKALYGVPVPSKCAGVQVSPGSWSNMYMQVGLT
jgi:hypothetical protein